MLKETIADGIELYCCDFREVMPDGIPHYDHLITDAPYEQISQDATGNIRRNDGAAAHGSLSFRGIDDLRDDLLGRVNRHCPGWFLSFCTTEGVALWRDAIERQNFKYKTPCIWVKPDAMPKFNGQGPSHGHECIVTAWCGSGYSRWNGGGRRGTFIHNCNWRTRLSVHDGGHQTEKPLSLMSELVCLFTDQGQTVLDPFMGTGTTGEACLRTGRNFIGIEQDEKWFTLACRRLEKSLRQTDLFVAIPKPKQVNMGFKAARRPKRVQPIE